MNKYLRQLFTAVIALFVVLGMSTTIITAIRANSLSSDPRNARALYQEYGAPRGAILASDGTILAQSTPVNDVFSYQRSYTNGPVYAPVTGFFSVTQRGDRGIESSRNKLLSGKADALFWDQLKSLFTGARTRARPSRRPSIPSCSSSPTSSSAATTAPQWSSRSRPAAS